METINIYGEDRQENYTKSREGCRGIVIRDGMILMSYEQTTDFWVTPGGGLEAGESLEECCIREIQEETGYIVKPTKHYLTLNEYYDEWKYINNYFICDISGTGEKHLTPIETERCLTHRWIPFEEAYRIFSEHEKYIGINIDKVGSYLRDYTALVEYLEVNKKANSK